jgi:hypothetical protein
MRVQCSSGSRWESRHLDFYNWLMRQMVEGEVEYDPVRLPEMLLGELEVHK